MDILIVTPAPPKSRHGNRVTALRWQRLLRGLGHHVSIGRDYTGGSHDLLIALHARRSYSAVRRFHRQNPCAPLVVALTGTDIYRNLPHNRKSQESLRLATRLIVLQPKALDELEASARRKARVIYQSVARTKKVPKRSVLSAAQSPFIVCVVGYLRSVKDPLRAAKAARTVARASRLQVVHLGGAMSQNWERRAKAEMKANPRYRWLGERTRSAVAEWLRRSQLFVISSRMEGGANALGEAIVAGVPVLASRIPGNTGILGNNYPGLFPAGDTKALAALMTRAERDGRFLARLGRHCARIAPRFDLPKEKEAWAKLLRELPKPRK